MYTPVSYTTRYEKVFDRVRHEPLIQCLGEIGVDGKDHPKPVLGSNSDSETNE